MTTSPLHTKSSRRASWPGGGASAGGTGGAAHASAYGDPLPDLGERYELCAHLGAGGMSQVYRVYDRARDEEVALKILNDDSAARLGSEFRFIASLNHPGVIGVHDFGLTVDGRPFFTMELAEGGDIVQFARRASRRELVRAVREVFETLDFVHARGVVHGDLKPGNMLFSRPRSAGGIARLLDFGIARKADDVGGGLSGTVHYMAPELILGRQRDHRTDLYAMGTLLYELLTGRLPFDAQQAVGVLRMHLKEPAPDPARLAPDVAGPLSEIVLRLLEKAPADRFARARDVARALDEWLTLEEAREDGPATSDPPDVPASVVPPAARSSARISVLGFAGSGPRIAGGARFVGREAELQQLVASALDLGPRSVRPRTEGGVWIVTGPSGIGKTRLVDEMRVRVQLGGLGCLFVGMARNGRPLAALERLAAVVVGAAGAGTPQVDVSDALRGEEPASAGRVGGSALLPAAPQADRLIPIAEKLASICAELAHARPFVLVLEALDTAGREVGAAVRAFVSRLSRSPVLVVVTGEEPEAEPLRELGQLPGARTLRLEPLGREGTALVVKSLLGELDGTAAIVDHVHDESAGIPAAIEHAVRALVAVGAIAARHGVWMVAPELGGKLPTLAPDARHEEIARAMVGGLSATARDLAVAAACVGGAVDPALLVAVAHRGGIGAEEAEQALRELQRGHVLAASIDDASYERGAPRLRFAHRALGDIVLEQADTQARARWSQCIVDAVAGLPEDERSPELEALLARHWLGVGRVAEAAEKAASLLRVRGPSDDMVDVVRRALEHGPAGSGLEPLRWCELNGLLAETELRRGNSKEASCRYEEVVRITAPDALSSGAGAEPEPDVAPPTEWDVRGAAADRCRVEALCALGDVWMEQGRPEGESLLRRALAEARGSSDARLVGHAAYALANRLTLSGRHDEASAGIAEALEMADVTDDRPLRALARKLSATLQWYLGRLEQAEQEARGAADEYRALGSPHGAALSLGALGNALLASGRLEQAADVFREALEHARAARWLTGIGKLENGLAVAAFRADDWDGACDHWRAALAIADRTGNCVEQVILTNNVAFVAARRGDGRGASRLYREALELAVRVKFPRGQALVQGNLGELRASQGRLAEARAALTAALDLARSIGSKVQEVEAQRRLLDVALLEGREDPLAVANGAAELLDVAQASAIGTEIPPLRRTLGTAWAALRRDDPRRGADAARALEQSAAGFEQLGSHYEASRVVALAHALHRRGIEELGPLASRVGVARRLFRSLRAQPDLDLLRMTEHVEARPGGAGASLGPGRHIIGAAPTLDARSFPSVSFSAPASLRPTLDPDVGRLLDAIRDLADVRGLEDLLPRLVDRAIGLAGADRGFVVLCDGSGAPQQRVSRGMGGEPLDPEQIRVSRSILHAVMTERLPVVAPDLTQATNDSLADSVVQLGVRTVACLPLLDDEALVGVLYVEAGFDAPDCSPSRLALLEPFAQQAALALVTARRMEQHARHAEAVATGAHELVNPIRAIVGYCRLMEEPSGHNRGQLQEHASRVHDQVRRLSRMVAGLVDLADTAPAELGWTGVSVQVKDLVETAVEQLRPIASLRSAAIDIDVPAGLPTLFGSRDRLVHALVSLLATSIGLCGRGTLRLQARWADSTMLSMAPGMPSRVDQIDPLLPTPNQGWQLSTDVPIRIDITSIPADVRELEGAEERRGQQARRAACQAVLEQLRPSMQRGDARGTSGAEVSAPEDPTLRVASRLVGHHGGVLWGEPVGSEGVRLSLLLPVLVQTG